MTDLATPGQAGGARRGGHAAIHHALRVLVPRGPRGPLAATAHQRHVARCEFASAHLFYGLTVLKIDLTSRASRAIHFAGPQSRSNSNE